MKKLVFLGSNYNMFLMTDIADLMGISVAGIVDSDYYGNRDDICGVPVIGTETDFDFSNYVCFHAVSPIPITLPMQRRNTTKRMKLRQLADSHMLDFINLIHPTAVIAPRVKMGMGNLICAGAIISNNVVIGNHCRIREQSFIAHDVWIGDDSTLQAQSYVGDVKLGARSFVAVKGTVISAVDGIAEVPADTFVRAAERLVIRS